MPAQGVTFEPSAPPVGPRPPDPQAGFHRRRWQKHRWFAFTLGAAMGGLAGFANTTYGLAVGLPFALIDVDLFIVVLVAIVAPIVEEHVKLLPLVFLRAEERATYTPRRWMVLGALSGLGFGVAEALLYWQSIVLFSFDAANLNLVTRLLLTIPLHGLTVTLSGYGFGVARMRESVGPLARGLVLAILIHASYNAVQVARALGALP